jgi:hypothetical protein
MCVSMLGGGEEEVRQTLHISGRCARSAGAQAECIPKRERESERERQTGRKSPGLYLEEEEELVFCIQ